MKPLSEKYHISYPFAIAIVFPELIRYSALRDKIEITLLKALYINLGEEYADFSIGPFQMKPSFAELIHEKVLSIKDRKIKNQFQSRKYYEDIRKYRSSIVGDLENLKTQFIYLLAFVKICESNYQNKWKDENEELKFFATVYNCGLNKSTEIIESMTDKKFFNTGLIKTDNNYSYADISIYWYNSFKKKN